MREGGRAMATHMGGYLGGGSSSCSLKRWRRRRDCCQLEASHKVSGDEEKARGRGKGEKQKEGDRGEELKMLL